MGDSDIDLTGGFKYLFSVLGGRAQVSKRGALLKDEKAEEIIDGLALGSKHLKTGMLRAIFLGIRASVFDRLVDAYIDAHPDCVVLHLGCGLDSRVLRVKRSPRMWYDIDFPEVIGLRRKFFSESETNRMIGADVADLSWLEQVEGGGEALIIAEAFTMFLTFDENRALIAALRDKFNNAEYNFDAYSHKIVPGAADIGGKLPRGRAIRFGIQSPKQFEEIRGAKYAGYHDFYWSSNVMSLGLPAALLYKIFLGRPRTNRYYRIYKYQLFCHLSGDQMEMRSPS